MLNRAEYVKNAYPGLVVKSWKMVFKDKERDRNTTIIGICIMDFTLGGTP
jgi:hypothetical protein